MSKTIYGLGRSRSNKGKGEWTGIHLNDYTMCIHTLVGAGFPTMQVLVVEVEDEQTSDKADVGVSQQGRERSVDD
jgi:hypothetical protein